MRPTSTAILCAAALVAGCSNGSSFFAFGGPLFDETATREDRLALDFGDAVAVAVDSSFGDIDVVGTDTESPRLVARVAASGRTRVEAEEVLARAFVEVRRDGDTLVVGLVCDPLVLEAPLGRQELVALADFELWIPAGADVVATTGSGTIRATGELGAVDADTRYGDVEVAGAGGDVHARSGSGDVAGADLVGGAVVLESDYGDVTLAGVRGDSVRLRSSSGSLALVGGASTGYDLSTDYGDVEVRDASGALLARTASGSVRVDDFTGPVDAESRYGDVEVDALVGDLRAVTASGDVTVVARAGSLVESPWELASSYGDVELVAPADLACVLDASTGYGEIACEFDLLVNAGERDEDRLRGTIGAGGPALVMTSSSGDVELRRR
jgi:DUF4097 and DUF4098 domain-containing protein YvlB